MRARSTVAALMGVLALLTSACSSLPRSSADVSAPKAEDDLGAQEVLRDQVFAERESGPLKLDLFLPEPKGAPAPLVVYVHGGSWEGGNRGLGAEAEGTSESLAAERLVERGYAVATVDYQFSSAAAFPAPIVDVSDAVRWLRANAQRWTLDRDRIVLWGASAGGHIVSTMGANTDGSGPAGRLEGIRAVVNWFGPTDMTAEAEQDPRVSQYARGVVHRFLGCSPTECPDAAEAASPVHNLSGDEPPFLLQHGMADSLVPVSQSLDFAAELRRLGATVRMHPYEGVRHGFRAGPMRASALETMVKFVETHA